MAEINQPTPIKPIWPTRQDERPRQQKRPEEEGREDANSETGEKRNKDKRPRPKHTIDEYA